MVVCYNYNLFFFSFFAFSEWGVLSYLEVCSIRINMPFLQSMCIIVIYFV